MRVAELSICVVDDEETIRYSLGRLFEQRGHTTTTVATGAEAITHAEQESPDVFLLDLLLPDMDGVDVLRRIKEVSRDTAVIMISGHGNIERAVEAMKVGAENFVSKPVDVRRLEALVETVGKCLIAERANDYYRRVQGGASPFVGVSAHTQKILQLIDLMTQNPDTTLLLSGESGTGKGVVAAAVHHQSIRAAHPFVEVNCAALTQPLLESELFGHERGAFTDAKQRKKGLIEVADGGTLFLDEIGELDLALQPKLLKVLESHTFRRVGGVRDINSNVRIVAATNVDLDRRVEEGRFREDLYYRLKVMPVHLLPLRERPEDIVPLVEHFLARLPRTNRRWGSHISSEALACLQSYGWPGNVRELGNVLERAVILARKEEIGVDALPSQIIASPTPGPQRRLGTLAEVERQLILDTLTECDGNRTRAAKQLGISRSTLQEKLKRYGQS